MNKLISVVMPVYNADKFLGLAIESILNQSYQYIELIIINDGSSDKSGEIISKFANSDKRVRVISRENKGIVYSLNEGISLAKGDYIARMDADDISLPERFAQQILHLETSGTDLCGTWIQTFGAGMSNTRRFYTQPKSNQLQLIFNSPFAHPTVLGKASVFKDNLYCGDYEYCEDYELWCRMAMQGVKMSNVPSILLHYRLHSEQVSSLKKEQQSKLRASVSAHYVENSHLPIESRHFSLFMKRSGSLEQCEILSSLQSLINFRDKSSDEEDVLKTQCFLFLLRFGYINKNISTLLTAHNLLGTKKKLILWLARLIGFNHNTRLYRFLTRFK